VVRLERVNERTFGKVVDMKLSEEQNRYVAPNVVSLAQAWLSYEEARPYAVCDGDEVVGFIMLDWGEGERTVGIWRFMIATEHQNHGYGRAAMEAAIQMIRAEDKFDLIQLDYVEGNTVARQLYYSLGFRENGEVEDGEIIMTLPLTDHPKVGSLLADMDHFEDLQKLVSGLRESGVEIPEIIVDEEKLRQAVKDKQVTRYTLMGKTVGIGMGEMKIMIPTVTE